MFSVKIPSFETYKTGLRPAVLTSLGQILKYCDIDLNHKIFFNNEAEVSKLLGGEYNGRRGDDVATDVGFDNKIFVELERELAGYNDELDGNTTDDTVPPVWRDPITGSTITPKYSTRRFNVTVNKYFKDRVSAERFYTNIRSKTLGIHQNSEFSTETHYPITYPMMQCYKEIFDRLIVAKQLPDDKDFIDWMMECSTVPSGILRNLIGNNPVFVFKQCIDEIGINMENPNMAQVNQGSYIGKYEVSFRYWFFWSEHTEWINRYPLQVYQQPMPEEYIPDVFEKNMEDYATRRFFESAASAVVFDYKKNKDPFYIVLPKQDNWRPAPEYWISPQLQVVVNMEDVDQQVLLNIKEIQGFDWNPKVLGYIMKYHDKVTNRHANPMQFKVYSDDIQVLESQIKLFDNGDLILTRKPRMSNIYRITFNFDYALRLYSEECIKDFLNDPEWAEWIIGNLFPQWPWNPGFGQGGENDWWDIHNGIEVGDGEEIHPYFPYGMLYSLIIAHREGQSHDQFENLMNKGNIDGTDYYRQY
ncbi:putative virion structural protein [Pseudomonas phage OBP]|uniref:putative virion structural protein n=1 Tax=Pseudomonas phage OBP TaxID=1124849 RepID=UPI000240D4A4|nr:putative virion structural protein [Pseudomonas phage OBP]AEV89555.1 putative virion structural protein [Pseudomonas phage OBP]